MFLILKNDSKSQDSIFTGMGGVKIVLSFIQNYLPKTLSDMDISEETNV